jgi:hypothetical protein
MSSPNAIRGDTFTTEDRSTLEVLEVHRISERTSILLMRGEQTIWPDINLKWHVGTQRDGEGWPISRHQGFTNESRAREMFEQTIISEGGDPDRLANGPPPGPIRMRERMERMEQEGEPRTPPVDNDILLIEDSAGVGALTRAHFTIGDIEDLEGTVTGLVERVDKLEKTLSTLVDLDVVALHKLLRYVERLGDPDA